VFAAPSRRFAATTTTQPVGVWASWAPPKIREKALGSVTGLRRRAPASFGNVLPPGDLLRLEHVQPAYPQLVDFEVADPQAADRGSAHRQSSDPQGADRHRSDRDGADRHGAENGSPATP